MQNLARKLIGLEAARVQAHGTRATAVERTCAKLRLPLAKLVGSGGFHSLLTRALAMAKAEDPSLHSVQAGANGSLEGLDGIESAQDAETGGVIVTHLLGLLVTFIGEPLTLRLVSDAWPDAALIEAGSEEGS